MKEIVVNRSNDSIFRYQGWPTVTKDEHGTLYVACSGHRLAHVCPFGKDLMYISYDDGEAWSSPIIVNDTALDDRDAGILSLGEGKFLLTYFCHPRDAYVKDRNRLATTFLDFRQELIEGAMRYWEGMDESKNRFGSFVRLSDDGCKTWSEAVRVPVSSPHGPTLLSNGKLLYLGKECYTEEYENAVYAFESSDGGRTWEYLSRVDFPDGCGPRNIHEPYAVELPDGRILGALRGQGDAVEHGFTVYFTVSEDGGKTWTHPAASGICGSPPHMLVHSSGAIVLTYGRRKAPYGERARISRDGGATWGDEIVISSDSPVADLGYPSSVELSDGSILTVYYQRAEGDNFTSILGTRWSIENN